MHMHRISVCFVLLLVHLRPAAALVPASERQALVELFHATGGNHWKNPKGWLTGDPCADSWFGTFPVILPTFGEAPSSP